MKKRFVEIDDGLDFSIKHIESGEIFYDCESVVDILNELAEENIELHIQNDFLNDENQHMRDLVNENKQLKFENNELKCALALDEVEYIIADGKKIDIPPYYEFEQRYDSVMYRREYDGYD